MIPADEIEVGDVIGTKKWMVVVSREYLPNPKHMWLIHTNAEAPEERVIFTRRDRVVLRTARRLVIQELGELT
jgi:hypothetical protein